MRNRWDMLMGAGLVIGIAALAGFWQADVARHSATSAAVESWQQVRERFPMPPETMPMAEPPTDLSQTIVHANPFSPSRQPPATTATSSSGQPTPLPLPPAQFVYKGRIMMSQTPRAILEDATAKKTYFVQTGQEVAGCKVSDIQERQVLLMNLATQESVVVPLAKNAAPGSSASAAGSSAAPKSAIPKGSITTP